MAWLRIDEHMSSHPAVLRAGDSALGLWVRMGCWLAYFPEQGDFIPAHMAKAYGTRTQIRRLVEAELWDKVEGGYRLHQRLNIAGSGLPGLIWTVDDGRQRRAIPAHIRATVYNRDDRQCVECGATEDLSLDHIWPFSFGGEDTIENLRTLCRPCNSRKGARV